MTTHHQPKPREASVLAALRALVPERPLTYFEAKRITELQAKRLRELLGITTPELPETAIPAIPRVKVVEVLDLPSSGTTPWHEGNWIILVNALEPWQRQRFSIGHELWHIINYRTTDRLCRGDAYASAHQQAERLADYFSGCLHMPRQQMRLLVHQGHDTESLADIFGVSTKAVSVRLSQLKLDRARCGRPTSGSWKMAS